MVIDDNRIKIFTQTKCGSKYIERKLIEQDIAYELAKRLLEAGIIQIRVRERDEFNYEYYSELIAIAPKKLEQ